MKLGQKVTVKSRMVRRQDWRNDATELHKHWHSVPIAPRECLVIGRRTIQDGFNECASDYCVVWRQTSTIAVFLVVENMKEAPFYVLASDLEGEGQ